MSKFRKIMPFFPVALFAIAALSGCSSNSNSGKRVLRILNSEDYIYEAEKNEYYCDECEDYINKNDVKTETVDGEEIHYHTVKETHEVYFDETEEIWFCDDCEDEVSESDVKKVVIDGKEVDGHTINVDHEVYMDTDLMDQFVEYYKEVYGEEISYVYDTFDTNETMFNELQTGKTSYDIIVTSDYMIQRLYTTKTEIDGNKEPMIHKISDDNIDNLWANLSPYCKETFKGIFAEDACMYDYCIPYMWGTVGVMYNPAYYMAKNPNLTEEEIHEDFRSWDTLYTEKYKDTFSIKDSVRDTYAVCTIHAFADEIAKITDNAELTELFNRCDAESMATVKQDMLKLKENAFGFETDSGKTDMTTQKIGANMCWSGDATWAITVAENPSLEDEDAKEEDSLILYYSIPTGKNYEEATNLWYDCLAMPNNGHSEEAEAQYELAERFIEFMCDPVNAAQNCDCVGYTPAVAGDAMLEYMYWCYDVRGEIVPDITIEEYAEANDLVEGEDYIVYDVSYFFDDSLYEYAEVENVAKLMAYPEYVGRQLTAQYPTKEDLPRLAIMRDFGPEGNQRLLDMWESVRTNSLPVWAIVLLCFEVAIGLGLGAYFIAKKVSRKKLKKARNTK